MRLPAWNATYRVQLTPDFGFDAAASVVTYLADLGISHLYLSPIFEARPGSTHGYDQTDPTRIREELGGEPGFGRLADAASGAGLAILLDIVPNHMAVHHANPWWFGLLKDGPGSRYDRFFDVDWASAAGRIVLPVLGAPLAEVLARHQLSVEPDAFGGRCVRYFNNMFPLRDDVPVPMGAPTPVELRALLSRQHYDLTFWREGSRRINYRRFFDISDLAGVRIEDPSVFEETHAKVFDLVARGRVAGVRVDHVDGLSDPLHYLIRLRQRLDAARPKNTHVPIFIEKILGRDETIPAAWPVDGATGYEFLAAAAGLLCEAGGIASLRRHAAATGAGVSEFGDLATACKREAAGTILEPELARVCRAMDVCLRAAGRAIDATALRRAVLELSSDLAVYRTYADDSGMSPEDVERVRAAARSATGSRELERVTELLTLSGPFADGPRRSDAIGVLRKWQQFTGPLAAKGVEDTALYRDIACPALNDVGTEPVDHESAAAVQGLAAQRRDRPLSLNATDTHDAKRSEDVRARLAAITHSPEAWTRLLDDAAAGLQAAMAGANVVIPTARTVSLIIHSAFGLWPLEHAPDATLAERLTSYIVKATRESKQSTSWTEPVRAYEEACGRTINVLLFAESLAGVRARIVEFGRGTRPLAARMSIAALMLKVLFPGTPDCYQGSEFRALSLVDPDNRRPVDFAARRRLLEDIRARWDNDPAAAAVGFLETPDSDVAKLFVTWRVLAVRRELLAVGGRMVLEASDFSASRWRWTVSVDGRRCHTSVILLEPIGGAKDSESAAAGGRNELAGSAPASPALWASIVLD